VLGEQRVQRVVLAGSASGRVVTFGLAVLIVMVAM
jgi:hypothetical protein